LRVEEVIMVQIDQVLISAASAFVYSMVFYAKARATDSGENLDYFKLSATLVVGVVIGIGYQIAGVDFGQAAIAGQLASYAGTVAIVESIIKAIYRKFIKPKQQSSGQKRA